MARANRPARWWAGPPAPLSEVVSPPHPQHHAPPARSCRASPESSARCAGARPAREPASGPSPRTCFGPRTAAAVFTGRTWLEPSRHAAPGAGSRSSPGATAMDICGGGPHSDHDTLDLVGGHRVRRPVVELRRLRATHAPRSAVRAQGLPPLDRYAVIPVAGTCGSTSTVAAPRPRRAPPGPRSGRAPPSAPRARPPRRRRRGPRPPGGGPGNPPSGRRVPRGRRRRFRRTYSGALRRRACPPSCPDARHARRRPFRSPTPVNRARPANATTRPPLARRPEPPAASALAAATAGGAPEPLPRLERQMVADSRSAPAGPASPGLSTARTSSRPCGRGLSRP